MSSEEELKRWLSRDEKTFEENLKFAIKAWKAVELAIPQKHEVILKWFSNNIGLAYKENAQDFNWDLVEEFLSLKCWQALISDEIKIEFIEAFVSLAEWHNTENGVQHNRRIVEVLNKVLQSVIVQVSLRSDPKIYCKLLNVLFSTYSCYLQNIQDFLQNYEGEFISKVLQSVNSFFGQLWQPNRCSTEFRKKTLTSLVEVVILLKSKKLNYFEELLEIERVLFLTNEDDIISEKFLALPVHVVLQSLECAIVHFRGHTPFLKKVLSLIFDRIALFEKYNEPRMILTIASHMLSLFRKQDINVNFEYDQGRTAIQFLGAKIEDFVSKYSQSHLYEVLILLCSALRLNPLILEKDVFGIMTKCLTARKREKSWEVYQEFVILLMEMFRKLSRSEKFVHNLLKSVSEYLKTNKISKKLKRKLKGDIETPSKKLKVDDPNCSTVSQLQEEEQPEENIFLRMLSEQYKDSKSQHTFNNDLAKSTSWPYIFYAWPSSTVGVAFSKFISNLISKPSMVVWKALIFSFTDTLTALETTPQLDENLLFLIDFNAALFCQYLAGSRLAEHSDKFWKEIEDNRTATCKLLVRFCDILLKFEYNNRMMNALLEMCYHISLFDMIRWNYCPDAINPKTVGIPSMAKGIHDYISKDKWTLIEQRIVNFGKSDCKVGINRLRLERLKACELILRKQEKPIDMQKIVLSSTFTEPDLIKSIFSNKGNLWIIKYLTKEQKLQICDLFLMDPSCRDSEFLSNFTEIHDFLELILINIFKYMVPYFDAKKSVLASIDFDELLISSDNDRIQLAVQAFKAKTEMHHIKKYVAEDIRKFLEIIAEMPIGYCRIPTKTLIFALTLALYKDLLAAKDKKLATACCDLLTDMLHIGESIKTFQYFEIDTFFSMFPPSTYPEFYELLFNTFKWMVEDAEICLEKIVNILKSREKDFDDDCIKLCILVLDSFGHHASVRKLKRFQNEILNLYASHVNKFFAEDDRDLDKDKRFVEKTLPGYASYLSWFLGKANQLEEIDEKFRKVCKIYIGHSMDCRNAQAIRLFSTALVHRRLLHFDDDEVEFVLQKYWDQMLNDVQAEVFNKNVDFVVKLVIGYKSNDDFAKILSGLEKELQNGKFQWIFEILSYIAKSLQITAKGVIFNSYFKKITLAVLMKLKRDSNNRYKDLDMVTQILEVQTIICENNKIPISVDLMDDILCFLTDLSIRNFTITDKNVEVFYKLHHHMTALCTALIKCRHLFLTDRIPQLVVIIRDLIQAICWYKCDRQKDDSLDQQELEKLAELCQKLESLMHLVTSHAIEVKRVAPYLLTFVIHLMVTNNRPTTLYPTIKTPIESICYDLISVCDHRVGGFILRCSNDAMKQVYETLCKEYKKYHKFKGKV